MFDWSDVTRRFKDLASLIDTKPVFRWGIITNSDPLLVQLDGDDRPIAGSPSTVIGGLAAGERVLCAVQNRRVTVIGRGGANNSNYMLDKVETYSIGSKVSSSSGWDITSGQIIVSGNTVQMYVNVTSRTSVSSHSDGNIVNQVVGTITDTSLRPRYHAVISSGTSGKMFSGAVATNGNINVAATVWGNGIDNGESFSLGGTWVR